MARKDKIKAEGGPTLFDGFTAQETPKNGQETPPVGEATADEWASIAQTVEKARQEAERAGVWFMFPTENLLRRGELYFNQRVGQIRDTMTAGGAAPEVVNVVIEDYAGVLSGIMAINATASQMQQALKALKPYEAFTIDRYGLYYGLLLHYSRFLLRFKEYTDAVKGKDATDETKRAYLSAYYPAIDARAVRWLLSIGLFEPSDFSGFDPGEMRVFFDRITAFASIGVYTLYYVVARLALVATAEELADVEAPPALKGLKKSLPDFCENILQDTVTKLNKAAEKFGEAVKGDTHREREQGRQAGNDWHDATNAQPVKIHENYGIVLSRPVNVSPNGEQIVNTLPVQQYIDEFNVNPRRFTSLDIQGDITQMTVQKVFEGVNLLPSYLAGTMRVIDNGRFEFKTNISEFSEICGYSDASQPQKQALLGALMLLSNLYFVVDKPKRYEEFTNAKGRKVKRMTGGRVALRFLNVPEIGLDTGTLRIEVYPESLKGRPTLITPETYKQLRAEAKGLTQSRFNFQIATKSHKSELNLIDDVFGFRDMLANATAEDLPKVTKYVQGHRSRERGRLLGWFDDYVKAGIITDFKRVPSKTNKRDFVLSWHCPDPSKLTPPPLNPDRIGPDEQ